MMKTITIIGGSGYLGNRCIKTLLNNSSNIKIYAISRNIELHKTTTFDERVKFVRGDALNPENFKDFISKSDGIIHTVGKLLTCEPPSSDLSYDKVNYETAMKVANIANDSKSKKSFVYISAERGLMFPLSLAFSGYIDSKRKAEAKLMKEFPNLKTFILRPGLITDTKERPYLTPLSIAFDTFNYLEKNVLDKLIPNIGNKANLPAGSIELDTLAIYAAAGSLGKLDEQIISNDYMKDLSNLRKINFNL
jgi:nucleoside-diphosphate-sugar epimerase